MRAASIATVLAAADATALTVVLVAAIVLGWLVLGAIYMLFFRGGGRRS